MKREKQHTHTHITIVSSRLIQLSKQELNFYPLVFFNIYGVQVQSEGYYNTNVASKNRSTDSFTTRLALRKERKGKRNGLHVAMRFYVFETFTRV